MTTQSRAAGLSKGDIFPLLAAAVMVLLSFVLLPSTLVQVQLRPALLVTSGFALVAWGVRGVSTSGALAGWALAFLMYLAGGRRLFTVLLTVFLLTLAATLAGRVKKRSLGLAEHHHGRNAAQVLANLGVAAGCMLLARIFGPVVLVCAAAALAEAAADTVSSEIGQAFGRRTVLITRFSAVQPGTNGGITLLGSTAGLIAAIAISAVGYAVHLLDRREAFLVAVAGVVGMFMDSVAGAAFENRGWLSNEAVNLIGTTSAVLAVLLLLLFR